MSRLGSLQIDGPPTAATSLEPLIEVGPGLFDIYDKVLSQPDTSPYTLARLYRVLGRVKADRTRFIPPTLRWLNDKSDHMRRVVVTGLAEIGTAHEAAPVVALLWDPKADVQYQAARTLSLIGDDRSLLAMDIWLDRGPQPVTRPPDFMIRSHVQEFRDELKARLDRERAAAPKK